MSRPRRSRELKDLVISLIWRVEISGAGGLEVLADTLVHTPRVSTPSHIPDVCSKCFAGLATRSVLSRASEIIND